MARQPSPCPRLLPIKITHHARTQAVARALTEDEIKAAIVYGQETATEELGQKGGFISKFHHSYVDQTTGSPVTKTVVAVCEAFPDRYVLITAYR